MSRPARSGRSERSERSVGLDQLAAVKQALDQARRQRLAAEAEQRERAACLEHERQLFSRTVGSVVPLRRQPPAPLERQPPPAVARQRELDDAAVLHEAISDEFDVESLLETDDALSFRRADIGIDVLRKLRRGGWAIQAELDLHGLRRDEARQALGDFLRLAVRKGIRCVRVVHGKGLGSPGREPVLKSKVKSWLVQRQQVIAFVQARPADGGHGALVVLLRPAAARPQATNVRESD
ncbi:Smr/MutS family protein [Piscinibacter sakaiensis]|uniref:Smr/MutS family protein n=1 Tax=Piscinibacter sakaiensis TaxID=1547922 RepID=UPI003AB0DE6A